MPDVIGKRVAERRLPGLNTVPPNANWFSEPGKDNVGVGTEWTDPQGLRRQLDLPLRIAAIPGVVDEILRLIERGIGRAARVGRGVCERVIWSIVCAAWLCRPTRLSPGRVIGE